MTNRSFADIRLNGTRPVGVAGLATRWHEVPMPPLEGEVPNEREAEGFVRKLSR